jgi:hypothetical protein
LDTFLNIVGSNSLTAERIKYIADRTSRSWPYCQPTYAKRTPKSVDKGMKEEIGINFKKQG